MTRQLNVGTLWQRNGGESKDIAPGTVQKQKLGAATHVGERYFRTETIAAALPAVWEDAVGQSSCARTRQHAAKAACMTSMARCGTVLGTSAASQILESGNMERLVADRG